MDIENHMLPFFGSRARLANLVHFPIECPENEKIECGNPLCVQTCATIDEKCTKFPIRCECKLIKL